jgi:hypothetical protein
MARSLQKDEWIVYAAFLPALLILGAVGATAAVAWHAGVPWHTPAVREVCTGTDDYVQGLAKRGIVNLPGYDVPPAKELSIPAAAIAAAELRAHYAC